MRQSDYIASSGSNDLTVSKAPQIIRFGALADKDRGSSPFPVSATGGASGNPVTFSVSGAACRVTGTTVEISAVGNCSIQADQAGNTDYAAATSVTQSFLVTQRIDVSRPPGSYEPRHGLCGATRSGSLSNLVILIAVVLAARRRRRA